MKSKITIFFLILIYILNNNLLLADNLNIKSKKIKIDEKKGITIFQNKVEAYDQSQNYVSGNYGEFEKNKEILILKGNVNLKTKEGYTVSTEQIKVDNLSGIIESTEKSLLKDLEGNEISVEMFRYNRDNNIFSSVGKIIVNDKNKNKYQFSEIYIDEKNKKIIGSDLRAFFNPSSFSGLEESDPRIFSNSLSVSKDKSAMGKGVFTFCKLKNGDKCPAWSIRADKIEHVKSKKTIFYEKAVLKIFDFPIFYFPKFFHPDPSVKRQSGFLAPSIVDSSNLGTGVVSPYYLNLGKDKDITLTPKIYSDEHPLIQAEYRQAFKNSFLIVDTSYTEGYKNSNSLKEAGSKNHFFSKLNYDFIDTETKKSNFLLNIQKVSHSTYLKVYDLSSALFEKEIDTIENSLTFNYEDESSSIEMMMARFEKLSVLDNSRFEYVSPAITFNKDLPFLEDYGNINFTSNFKIRNYEIDKHTQLFVNDFSFNSLKWINKLGFNSQLKSTVKNINYNTKNVSGYNNDKTRSELHGAIGYLGEVPMVKRNEQKNLIEYLTPKFLLRYSPNEMRELNNNVRLTPSNIFNMDRVNELDVVESGLSASIGIAYEKTIVNNKNTNAEKNLSISLGQIINEKEDKDRPTPLDQRFSDLVGEVLWDPNSKVKLKYNFNLDQNYETFNYNEVSSNFLYGPTTFNISFLEERENMGMQRYFKTDLDYNINDFNKLNISTKRNLLKNSAEFYNLSYQYAIDCFKAGVMFRREFYNDRDIEPEDSLMFNISIIPLTNINSPKFE